MKINETSNNSFQNKVLIDTFIEQISALQTDVGNLQIADDNFAQELTAKANTADIANEVVTDSLDAQTATIKTLDVQGEHSSATIENATLGSVSIGTETVNQSDITNLHAMDIHTGTVRTGTLRVNNDATIGGNIVSQDINAKDITSASVSTLNVVAAEGEVNRLEAQTAEVTNKLTVNDLEVSGTFTGVSHIETEEVDAESVKSDEAEIETLKTENIRDWVSQVMNRTYALTPSPQLGNVDRYTIELPSFDGVFLLSWEDSTNVIWSATVIGNGQTYGISWGSRTDENFITDLFEYRGKLYIRINCNGRLKYAYSATQELGEITIYYNMDGWTSDKSLEELCDENTHIINVYPSGMAWFGPVFIPRLNTLPGEDFNIVFRGSCALEELPSLVDSEIGDVWNITTYGYTNSNFVEGAGNPINIGDDVIAVVEKIKSESIQEKPLPGKPPYSEGTPISLYDFGTATICCAYNSSSGNYIIYKKVRDEWVPKYVSTSYNPWIKYPTKIGNRFILFDASGGSGGSSICIYSDDNGETWTRSTGSGEPYPTCLGRVILENGHIISATRSGYLHKSENNGATWNAISSVIIDNNSNDHNYGVAPLTLLNDGSILGTVANWGGQSVGLLRSTDEGSTWNVYSTGLMIEPNELGVGDIIRTSQGTLIYNGGIWDSSAFSYIYGHRSTDDGLTWTPIGQQLDKIVELNDILYSSSGLQSTDDGITWTEIEGIERKTYSDIAILDNNSIWFSYIEGEEYSDERTYKAIVLYLGPESEVLKWDKFAAGVNYENFVAEKITATDALKSEGTLEVDGKTTLNDDAEFTKENAEITENGIIITNTGNKVETVAGTSTESVTGAKTVNLTAGETINGNVELNGDLTQTGDQDITGSVEISETETINNLAPEEKGRDVAHNYWEVIDNSTDTVYKTYTDNNVEVVTTEGTRGTPVELVSNLCRSSNIRTQYPLGLGTYHDTVPDTYLLSGGDILKVGNDLYTIDYNNAYIFPAYSDPHSYRTYNETTFRELYIYKNSTYLRQFYLNNNNFYATNGSVYYKYNNRAGSFNDRSCWDEVTDATEIEEISAYTYAAASYGAYYLKSFRPVTGMNETEVTFGSPLAIGNIYTYNSTTIYTSPTYKIQYVPYSEHIDEVDPNHQYTAADEVLTVKGSEKVTRDLKVQGWIYQDDYNRAILPNINANTINSNGGTLVIGELL